jgi:hypothetical protein
MEEVSSVAATILEGHARNLLGRKVSPREPEFAEKLEVATRPDYDKIGFEIVGKVVVRTE